MDYDEAAVKKTIAEIMREEFVSSGEDACMRGIERVVATHAAELLGRSTAAQRVIVGLGLLSSHVANSNSLAVDDGLKHGDETDVVDGFVASPDDIAENKPQVLSTIENVSAEINNTEKADEVNVNDENAVNPDDVSKNDPQILTLETIPNEIKKLILLGLSPCFQVSLGLAIPSYYSSMKEIYPGKIHLDSVKSGSYCLHCRLEFDDGHFKLGWKDFNLPFTCKKREEVYVATNGPDPYGCKRGMVPWPQFPHQFACLGTLISDWKGLADFVYSDEQHTFVHKSQVSTSTETCTETPDDERKSRYPSLRASFIATPPPRGFVAHFLRELPRDTSVNPKDTFCRHCYNRFAMTYDGGYIREVFARDSFMMDCRGEMCKQYKANRLGNTSQNPKWDEIVAWYDRADGLSRY